MKIAQYLHDNFLNIPGWRTNRHIIVIESDDWGSIRMPSLEVYEKLVKNGVRFPRYGYERVDTIASRGDLHRLFDLCEDFKDINNNPIIITANAVVANPDFEKIKESDYTTYYSEPITKTMTRYYGSDSPFSYWHKGIDEKVFHPQLHGREHVNVPMWIRTLKEDYPGARLAFDHGVFSIIVDNSFDYRCKNTSALRYNDEEELRIIETSIIEAADMFERLFGYRSESFIAPSFSWNRHIEQILSRVGVKFLQGLAMHLYDGKRSFNYIGKRNSYGQLYLNRNVDFEVAQHPNRDNVDFAMSQIKSAFKWHKPATISMHRLNFVGGLDACNRDNTLKQMRELFQKIIKVWPDVEFMDSCMLGSIIDTVVAGEINHDSV